MSYQAYEQARQATESPRDMEYRLFSQVTRALMDAKDIGNTLDKRFIDAIDWNRRLWSHLSTDCSTEGNQLPDQVRAGIISLAIWVSRHSSEVVRGKEDIEDLIHINKTIMSGLVTNASEPESHEASVREPQLSAPPATSGGIDATS